MPEVNLHKGESVDKALRRLRTKMTREGTLKEARNRRAYKKQSKKDYEYRRRRNYNQRISSQNDE